MDPLRRDLRLVVAPDGAADLALEDGDVDLVEGMDNLAQALQLRLLTDVGELTGLGHPRYGGRLRELIGEPADRPNLELIRRHTRAALRMERRVAEVLNVTVTQRPEAPWVVDVVARIRAVSGAELSVQAALDLS